MTDAALPHDIDDSYLARACELGVKSVHDGGGPFGSVIVRGGVVVAEGTNRVTPDDDPTAHAEITAIRSASAFLGTHDLSGCTLYASCRPCPMCMAAAWWAHVDRIVHAAESSQAAAVGFDDARFWASMTDPSQAPVPVDHVDHPGSSAPFAAWVENEEREGY